LSLLPLSNYIILCFIRVSYLFFSPRLVSYLPVLSSRSLICSCPLSASLHFFTASFFYSRPVSARVVVCYRLIVAFLIVSSLLPYHSYPSLPVSSLFLFSLLVSYIIVSSLLFSYMYLTVLIASYIILYYFPPIVFVCLRVRYISNDPFMTHHCLS
jgi:hypothetical protein